MSYRVSTRHQVATLRRAMSPSQVTLVCVPSRGKSLANLGTGLGSAAIEHVGLVHTVLMLGACAQVVGIGLAFVPAAGELDHVARSD
jgi:hypothetical protein